ncbi:MAG TPA: cupin domain-containing protein [Geminicoccus sp.]|uniref:cupin domain-containing protein n=1 Tax=Geminicoccus sp. TaxID=2024832 RepID=UPI002E33C4A1|nr:cupin domain-containing protein [Geminicoccus sp.]HEX2527818.1 cupin domain-containing protein [Geminicoccus sp.]
MAACLVDLKDLDWETWDDPQLRANSAVRWKLVFSSDRTPTDTMSMGLAEIAVGGVLPLHHHEPAEIYHVLEGHIRVSVAGVEHMLHPGQLFFIPPDVPHSTVNAGPIPARILFVFPVGSFDDVAYHFMPQ